jgi:hypothetical protein
MNSIASTIWRRGTMAGAPADRPIEQVGHQLSLVIGEGDREDHGATMAARDDGSPCHNRPIRTGAFGYRA